MGPAEWIIVETYNCYQILGLDTNDYAERPVYLTFFRDTFLTREAAQKFIEEELRD